MQDCKQLNKEGCIERFGVQPHFDGETIRSDLVILLKGDERVFVIQGKLPRDLPVELPLFAPGDQVLIEGYEEITTVKKEVLVTKFVNKTLSRRLNKLVKMDGYNEDILRIRRWILID